MKTKNTLYIQNDYLNCRYKESRYIKFCFAIKMKWFAWGYLKAVTLVVNFLKGPLEEGFTEKNIFEQMISNELTVILLDFYQSELSKKKCKRNCVQKIKWIENWNKPKLKFLFTSERST